MTFLDTGISTSDDDDDLLPGPAEQESRWGSLDDWLRPAAEGSAGRWDGLDEWLSSTPEQPEFEKPPELTPEDRLLHASVNMAALEDQLFQDAPTDVSQLRRLNQIRRRFELPELGRLPDELGPVGAAEEAAEQFATGRGILEKVPFAGEAATATYDLATVLPAANRAKEGEATEDDLLILAALLERSVQAGRERTGPAKFVGIASQIPTFATEFLLTGGAGSVARKAATKTAAKLTGKAVSESVERFLAKRGIKGLTNVGAQVAAMSALKAPPQAVERFLPEVRVNENNELVTFEGEEPLEALKNAGFDMAVEVVSERSGKPIAAIGGFVTRPARKALRIPELKLNVRQFFDRLGLQGPVTEMAEERLGEVIREGATRAGLVNLPQQVPTWDQLLAEGAAFAIPGAARAGMSARATQKGAEQGAKVVEEAKETTPPIGPPTASPTAAPAPRVEARQEALLRDHDERVAAGQKDPTPNQGAFTEAGYEQMSRKERAAEIERLQQRTPDVVKEPAEPARSVPVQPSAAPKTTEAGEPSVTSIKNAVVDQERASRGLPAAMEPGLRAFGLVREEAIRVLDEEPTRQDALIAELAKEPRPVTDLEDALLLHRQISLQNEYDKQLVRHDKAIEAQDIEAAAQSDSQQEVLLAELLQLYDISKAVGTAGARGLNARKMLAAEDFSLVRMVAMKRKAQAVDQLSETDVAAVKETHRKIADLENKLREHTERITQLEADAASVQVTKTLVAAKKKRPSKKRTAVAKAELDQAWKDFEGEISGKLFANPLDPALIGSAIKLARAHINMGVATLQDFIAAVAVRIGKDKTERIGEALSRAWNTVLAEDTPQPSKSIETPEEVSRFARQLAKFFVSTGIVERDALIDATHVELSKVLPDITRRQAMDAISGYGQYSPLSQEVLDARLRDLKGQMQQIAKLEDMQAGQAPLKTGVERRSPSDEERRLIQQVNQMKKQGGFDITDPVTQLQSALSAAKTRLRNQITDLEHQIETRERIVKTRADVPQDEEVVRLTERRDILREQFDEIFGKRGMTNEQRVQVATAAAKRSIAEYERRIAERDFTTKRPTSKTQITAELQALRDRRDALKAEWTELRDLANPKKTSQERALSALKTRLRTRISEYQDRLARRDFAPTVRKKTVLDKEAEKLRFNAEQVKQRYLRELAADARKRRTIVQKILGVVPEALNTSRAILTSFDVSAVGRQGAFVGYGHPIRHAQALGDMFRAFRSKAGASRARNALEKRPNAALYKRARLELTDPEGSLSHQEEVYMARWSKFIPIVAGSERAYVTFLNRIRADTFDALTATLSRNGSLTEADAKAIANYVNVATGRGDLGQFRAASVPLATVFFAPRYVLSRFQYLTFQPLRGKANSARVRKLVAEEYARALTGAALFYSTAVFALYSLAGPPGDDEEWNIQLDPRSSDFGKIRIGNTRVDPMAGLQQVTVLLARLITGETKQLKTGDIVPIRGVEVPFGRSTGADVVSRFMRTKLSPAIGTSINILSGENVIGEVVTPKTIARDLTIPISLREIGVLMKEHGIPAGTVLQLLETFGVSTQNYDLSFGSFPAIGSALKDNDFEDYKEALGVFVDVKARAGVKVWASYENWLEKIDPLELKIRARQWWFDAYDEVVAPRLGNR